MVTAAPSCRLLPSRWTLAKLMAPFVLWELVVLIIFAISFAKLADVQEAIVVRSRGRPRALQLASMLVLAPALARLLHTRSVPLPLLLWTRESCHAWPAPQADGA